MIFNFFKKVIFAILAINKSSSSIADLIEFQVKKELLREIIRRSALVIGGEEKIVSSRGVEASWIFDLRSIFLKSDSLSLIADIFWHKFEKEYPFQIGGQEVAAIPLITAIIMKGHQLKKPVNGFIIRKERKHIGRQRIIEGEVSEHKIILVDDLINSGETIVRQLNVLQDVGRDVSTIFTIVNFRRPNDYEFISKKEIKLHSLFSLSDFGLSLNKKDNTPPSRDFEVLWQFQSPHPNYFHVVPKSAPAIDKERVYFGSDSGTFWALNQSDGSLVWKFKINGDATRKGILSSPALYKDTVYFGAYDGNVYALDAATGEMKWKFDEADWVGSSPEIAPELSLLFIGLEFGLMGKRGAIVALNLETGEKVWERTMKEYVHCSPAYLPSKKVVAIGGNDCYAYLFRAEDGKLLWKYKTDGEIKSSLAFNSNGSAVLFGSFDGYLYEINIKTGKMVRKFKTGDKIYSTPVTYGNSVIFASLDKHLYSLNFKSGSLDWILYCGGKIFSSPVVIGSSVYIGSNNGKLYEVNARTGRVIRYFQATERITGKISYNEHTGRCFVPTYANQLYCLDSWSTRNSHL